MSKRIQSKNNSSVNPDFEFTGSSQMLPSRAWTFLGQNSPASPSACRGRAKLSPPRRDPAAAGQFKIKNYPNFNEERKLWGRSYRLVVGLDEAGRGPLAGPVVAAAVVFKFSSSPQLRRGLRGGVEILLAQHLTVPSGHLSSSEERWRRNGIKDSKKLSAKQRQKWYKILINRPDIKWGIGIVSEKIIDRINILQATKLAMKKAISKLERGNCCFSSDRVINDSCFDLKSQVDFLIIDGNFKIDLPICQKSIIKADEKIISCAAASIIAKVTRDRLMIKYHKKYPRYGFDRHKGYGTRAHFTAIKKYGPCRIHRLSFAPFS